MPKLHISFISLFITAFFFAKGQALFPVEINGKWGYIDAKGQIEIAPTFTVAGSFSDSMAMVFDDSKICYINTTGKIDIVTTYDAANPFYEGMAAVMAQGRWGFINKKGDAVIEPQYFRVSRFCNGLCRIKQTPTNLDKWGYINKKGDWAIEANFDKAADFSEGMALVGNESENYGYIDIKGTTKVPLKFDYKGIKKVNGLETFPEGEFSEGLAAVNLGKKYGYINRDGKLVIDTQFEYAGQFSEGLAPVKKNGKYGFVDISGKIVLSVTCDGLSAFSEGLAAIKVGSQYGFINQKGETVIKPQFSINIPGIPLTFKYGIILVYFDSKNWGYINAAGKIIWKNN